MITISDGTAENLVIAVAHGKLTGEDYEKVLVPAIEAKLKTHKKIRLLFQLDRDYSGITAEAAWDDAKFGITHRTVYDAVAAVTDVHWIADAVKLFGVFLRCPVKVFGNDQLAEAMEWVATTPAWRSLAEAAAQ
jgi:hypothetical protein